MLDLVAITSSLPDIAPAGGEGGLALRNVSEKVFHRPSVRVESPPFVTGYTGNGILLFHCDEVSVVYCVNPVLIQSFDQGRVRHGVPPLSLIGVTISYRKQVSNNYFTG